MTRIEVYAGNTHYVTVEDEWEQVLLHTDKESLLYSSNTFVNVRMSLPKNGQRLLDFLTTLPRLAGVTFEMSYTPIGADEALALATIISNIRTYAPNAVVYVLAVNPVERTLVQFSIDPNVNDVFQTYELLIEQGVI